jgi:hypothetical protein
MKVQTFITTSIPFSARTRGANSDPRYASRLYRAFVANRAAAGVWPAADINTRKALEVRSIYHTPA